jgi:hypothetical protein
MDESAAMATQREARALACSYGNVGHVVSMDRLSARNSSIWPRDTALRGAMNAAAEKLSFTSVSLGLSVAPHPCRRRRR